MVTFLRHLDTARGQRLSASICADYPRMAGRGVQDEVQDLFEQLFGDEPQVVKIMLKVVQRRG
jgi:hypothetical protein